MFLLPKAAEPLLAAFSIAFTRPTCKRFLALLVGSILTTGRRTVTGVLGPVRGLVPGHFSDFHRVLSRARWSLWTLGRALAMAVVALIPPGQPILVAADDTVLRHRGPKVYGRGCHRDAVGSSHAITVVCWGHRWVVLAVVVTLPFTSRAWALPVLCALYRPREVAARNNRRFKTPCELARQLGRVLRRWFPDRRLMLLGDGGFASFDLARGVHRMGGVLVARFYDDAGLYEPAPRWPPDRPGPKGRKPIKGGKLPAPRATAAHAKPAQATIRWYGGRTRRVALVSRTGMWYRSGRGVVAVRWVRVRDLEGTHRDEYLFSTDPSMTPQQIAEAFTARWCIETTFQEANAHLGLATPRQRCERSVLRTAPCLLGLFSVVSLIAAAHARRHGTRAIRTADRPWYAKPEPTFADALSCVRRLLWRDTILATPRAAGGFKNAPPRLLRYLLDRLAQAA
jgi:hypothetical protein